LIPEHLWGIPLYQEFDEIELDLSSYHALKTGLRYAVIILSVIYAKWILIANMFDFYLDDFD
jgi:hypothetical protein